MNFDKLQDYFYFITGALGSALGAAVTYTRFIENRATKRYAAEKDFLKIKGDYEQIIAHQRQLLIKIQVLEDKINEQIANKS